MALNKYDNILAQRVMNETLGLNLEADGAIGPASRTALAVYQRTNNLTITNQLDQDTWAHMQGYIQERFVTVNDIIDAAKIEGLPASMLLAFWQEESVMAGFFPDKRLMILFEGHQFYKYVAERLGNKTAVEWARKYPNICYKEWTRIHYRKGVGEWVRFEQARSLDAPAALLATSYGLFQQMGFNYQYSGFSDVQTMYDMFNKSEHAHLRGIINFINNNRINATLASSLGVTGLRDAIIQRKYAAVARIYNGPGYASQDYHTRLRKADEAWAKQV